jgi:hypothetical protein
MGHALQESMAKLVCRFPRTLRWLQDFSGYQSVKRLEDRPFFFIQQLGQELGRE